MKILIECRAGANFIIDVPPSDIVDIVRMLKEADFVTQSYSGDKKYKINKNEKLGISFLHEDEVEWPEVIEEPETEGEE